MWLFLFLLELADEALHFREFGFCLCGLGARGACNSHHSLAECFEKVPWVPGVVESGWVWFLGALGEAFFSARTSTESPELEEEREPKEANDS